MKICLQCSKELTGRQLKFCALECKNTYNNLLYQQYGAQSARGIKKKLKLVEHKGGACTECGYRKNLAGLCFHHIDPETKSMPLSNRECANNSMKKLLEEVDKCTLLCHNCHTELHHPNYDFGVLTEKIIFS